MLFHKIIEAILESSGLDSYCRGHLNLRVYFAFQKPLLERFFVVLLGHLINIVTSLFYLKSGGKVLFFFSFVYFSNTFIKLSGDDRSC